MRKITRLSPQAQVDIVRAYSEELVPMIALAEKYGVTRQAIFKCLRRAGVDTRKRRIAVSCSTCGETIHRTKGQIRARKHLFCDAECYYAFLDAGNGRLSVASRAGQRRARDVVSKHFRLLDGHVVHHEDRNQMNNHPSNLRVFATQGDHIRYHRLGPEYVQPVWDGSKV